ncbi:MAG: alpha/beta hydrolase [Bacteriovoracaceae bacterium]|nr:alpha/beta hydrolase [Bacteriovoracaceae bacterium]
MQKLKNKFNPCLIFFCFWIFTGCSHLFYYPDKTIYDDPSKHKIIFEDYFLPLDSKMKLHVRYFPSNLSSQKKSWAVVLQFHGNAQNLSSHYGSVYWLTQSGIDVVTFDYRGYGKSSGKAEGKLIREDSVKIWNFVYEKFVAPRKLPLIGIGQSLGGAILLKSIEDITPEMRSHISSIILESTFFSYHEVAKTKLKSHWLTYPINWLVPALITDNLSLQNWNAITMPTLILHDQKDPVVPASCSASIFENLKSHKVSSVNNERWTYETPYGSHTASFFVDDYKFQEKTLIWLKKMISHHGHPFLVR